MTRSDCAVIFAAALVLAIACASVVCGLGWSLYSMQRGFAAIEARSEVSRREGWPLDAGTLQAARGLVGDVGTSPDVSQPMKPQSLFSDEGSTPSASKYGSAPVSTGRERAVEPADQHGRKTEQINNRQLRVEGSGLTAAQDAGSPDHQNQHFRSRKDWPSVELSGIPPRSLGEPTASLFGISTPASANVAEPVHQVRAGMTASRPSGTTDSADTRALPKGKAMGNPSQMATLYDVSAYAHSCIMPRFGPEGPPRRGANGRWPISDLTVAADASLHAFGSELIIEGLGLRVVGDRGRAIKGHRLDLFVSDCATARAFGRRMLSVVIVPAASTQYRGEQ